MSTAPPPLGPDVRQLLERMGAPLGGDTSCNDLLTIRNLQVVYTVGQLVISVDVNAVGGTTVTMLSVSVVSADGTTMYVTGTTEYARRSSVDDAISATTFTSLFDPASHGRDVQGVVWGTAYTPAGGSCSFQFQQSFTL